jgi:hypothetical protein
VHEFLKSDSTSLISAAPFIYSLVNSTKSFKLTTVSTVASVGITYLKLKVSLLSWPNSYVAVKDFKV